MNKIISLNQSIDKLSRDFYDYSDFTNGNMFIVNGNITLLNEKINAIANIIGLTEYRTKDE